MLEVLLISSLRFVFLVFDTDPWYIDTYLSNLRENYIRKWFPFEFRRIAVVTLGQIKIARFVPRKRLIGDRRTEGKTLNVVAYSNLLPIPSIYFPLAQTINRIFRRGLKFWSSFCCDARKKTNIRLNSVLILAK